MQLLMCPGILCLLLIMCSALRCTVWLKLPFLTWPPETPFFHYSVIWTAGNNVGKSAGWSPRERRAAMKMHFGGFPLTALTNQWIAWSENVLTFSVQSRVRSEQTGGETKCFFSPSVSAQRRSGQVQNVIKWGGVMAFSSLEEAAECSGEEPGAGEAYK